MIPYLLVKGIRPYLNMVSPSEGWPCVEITNSWNGRIDKRSNPICITFDYLLSLTRAMLIKAFSGHGNATGDRQMIGFSCRSTRSPFEGSRTDHSDASSAIEMHYYHVYMVSNLDQRSGVELLFY